MLAKRTSKNQITLPREIAKEFPDTVYFDVALQDNYIVLKPVKMAPSDSVVEEVRKKMKRLGITEKDIDEAVAWARSYPDTPSRLR